MYRPESQATASYINNAIPTILYSAFQELLPTGKFVSSTLISDHLPMMIILSEASGTP
jgi:hypothetical protein